jgi:hypothetical protein
LSEILATKPIRSKLVWLLVGLDMGYAQTSPNAPWSDCLDAERIVDQLGA